MQLYRVNTTLPHLLFADGYFRFSYAGSVFTHIDDFADAWFLELRRITRAGGHLYVTIHDDHTLASFRNEYTDYSMAQRVRGSKDAQSALKNDYAVFTIGRGSASQVYYQSSFLR